ncbi:MAG TPA: hypothetical protein VH350_02450 [Candidatus Sulfotelmatobacter sp.]|jgi:hypothetical protein|nr:hypothetical protein [Candidatus Sulfotelmatobacter sp.]
MLRAFGAFLVVFSLLSFVVQLQALGTIFAIGALCFFAIDPLVSQFVPSPRPSRVREDALLL